LNSTGKTVALIENTPIGSQDLESTLYELAGKQALREAVLDHALRRELEKQGLSISSGHLAHERTLFEQRMNTPGNQQSTRIIGDEVYRSRGLGPTRRQAMFWRNAALRLLASGPTSIEQSEVDSALEIAYGPKTIARLILTENERDAAEVLRVLGPAPTVSAFARIAEQRSIDPTASRGGLLPPVHAADARFPVAIRNVLGRLNPGSISTIIPLDIGSAVLMVESKQPASVPPEAAEERLRGELTIQRERAAMDELARQLIARTRVDVLNHSLGWSWER